MTAERLQMIFENVSGRHLVHTKASFLLHIYHWRIKSGVHPWLQSHNVPSNKRAGSFQRGDYKSNPMDRNDSSRESENSFSLTKR